MKTEIEKLQAEHAMVVADLKLRLQIAERQHRTQSEIAILVTRELEEANMKLQKATRISQGNYVQNRSKI